MINAMTKKDLASLAGYTYRRLHEIDRDLPKDKKLFVECEGGKYDPALFVQRWVEYNVSAGSAGEDDLDAVKARHEAIKTQKTQLEVERMRGQLIDVQDVRRLWADVANTVTQNMIRLPSKLAPMLLMMDGQAQIERIIDEEIRKVLTEIAETPLPDYAETEEAGEAEEDEEA